MSSRETGSSERRSPPSGQRASGRRPRSSTSSTSSPRRGCPSIAARTTGGITSRSRLRSSIVGLPATSSASTGEGYTVSRRLQPTRRGARIVGRKRRISTMTLFAPLSLVGGLLSAIAALAGFSTAASGVTLKERFEKTVPMRAGLEVRLHNSNGAVTFEAWDRSEVEISAEKHVQAGDDATARKV